MNQDEPEQRSRNLNRGEILAIGATCLICLVTIPSLILLARHKDAPAPASPPPTARSPYAKELGHAYAAAWRAGARELKANRPVQDSLDIVRDAWIRNRTGLFNEQAGSRFEAIIPAGKPDHQTTHAEKLRLAEAWEQFADELEKP